MTKVRFYEIQGLTDKDSEVIIQHAQAEIIADAKMVKA